ncbi:hypothetical protein [Paremcibacter congregatus]|nr:hypothetical protein [Paremcibacter congregatus]
MTFFDKLTKKKTDTKSMFQAQPVTAQYARRARRSRRSSFSFA